MAEAALTKKRYTYEDYLKTPDDERYELIEGDSRCKILVTVDAVPCAADSSMRCCGYSEGLQIWQKQL